MMRPLFHFFFTMILLLLVSCQPQIETSKTVRLCPDNPRYIEYQGDPVILITSAEHYGAVVNLDFEYRQYLQTLGNEGFNYTRIFTGTYIEPVENIFGIEKNTLAPLTGSYLAPWAKENGKYDLERFNPDFFERLKDFVREAEKQEIIVEVTLFTSIYAENAWSLSPFNDANNVNGVGDLEFQRVNTLYNGELGKYQEAYIRKVVRELNEFDNIFFEIQNEPWSDNRNLTAYVNEGDEKYSRSWQRKVELANGLAMEWQEWVVSVIGEEEASLPKSHLIAQNICNFQHDLDQLPHGVSMINFHYALPGAALMNLDLGGVIGLDETGFMPHEDHLYLDQAWRIILSGAGLYNNLDYSFTAGNESGHWPIPETNPGWGGPGFREKLSILVETMEQVPFHEMEVSESILDPLDAGMKQYGLQKPGEVYLVFLEEIDGTELIPMVPKSKYEVTYINVDSGERESATVSLGSGEAVQSPYADNRLALMIRITQ